MKEEMIVRHVVVDRSPMRLIELSTRVKYVNNDTVGEMPCSHEKEMDVYFYLPPRHSRNIYWLLWECRDRGLVPVHPVALLQLNADEPEFGRKFPNATVWGYGRENSFHYNHIAFFSDQDGDVLEVDLAHSWPWPTRFWFAGVRK